MSGSRGIIIMGFPQGAGGASAPADVTAPTVEITSAAAATVYEAFDITVTFSEPVTWVTGLTVGNGTASELVDGGDGTTWTSTITPTAAGAVTVDVTEGAAQDAALNENEAATQFSRVYMLDSLALWLSADSGVYADAAKTTGPTDATAIEAWVAQDADGNTHDFLKDGEGATPVYIANATNGKPAIRFTAASSQYLLAAGSTLEGVAGPVTVVVVAQDSGANTQFVFGKSVGNTFNLLKFNGGAVEFNPKSQWLNSTAPITVSQTTIPQPRMVSVVHDSAQDANFYFKTHVRQTIAGTVEFLGNNGAMYLGRQVAGYYLTGDIYELLVFEAALSETQLEHLRAYFAAKYSLQDEWWAPPFNPEAYKGTYAASPLTIPTYEESGQAIHPSVVYFPDGWNGYDYWMAFTPYPGADASKENPSIVASNDKTTWVVPDGLTNPIAPNPGGGLNNSDTELVYDPVADTLYCVWREYAAGGTLYYLKSTNGVSWTNKTQIMTVADNRLICPCLNYVDGIFYLHSHDNVSAAWVMHTAASLDGPWSDPVATNYPHAKWHTGIKYFEGAFISFPDLLVSEDGVHWYDGAFIPPLPNPRPAWMPGGVYRGTGVKHANSIDVWYSGQASNVWNTGYSELT